MTRRRVGAGLAALLLGLGLWQVGEAGIIHAKARLARGLIANAWARTLAGGHRVKPWPWADTWPVARLIFPALGEETVVLSGGSGSTLAFGPGHVDGSPLPGEAGSSLIAGHRDTSFRFLADLRIGDEVGVEGPTGATRRFRVTALDVVDARSVRIDVAGSGRGLVLATCYPFDALVPGGPLRYLVSAEMVSAGLPRPGAGPPVF